MPILTLTTDWGLRDHYLASFKGELMTMIPTMQVIDISHEIEKFNTMQAAFILNNSFRKFPKETVHYIGLTGNENSSAKNPYVIVRSDDQYLLGEDNGIFTLILGSKEMEISRLPYKLHSNRNELSTVMYDTIKRLINKEDMYSIGTKDENIFESYFAQPTVDSETIRGTIIYIDSFGNAIVNIKEDFFCKEKRDRKFIIHFRKAMYNVSSISECYDDVVAGEILALFNKDGYLEIALNKESAAKLLGLKLMDPIRIEFNGSAAG